MTTQTKRLITGTMLLSFSGLIVKLINILYKLPLTNMVGLKTMGYFNTIYSTYLVLTAALLVGIPSTISKLVAEEREAGNIWRAHRLFRTGLLLSTAIGLCVGIAFIFLPSYAEIFAWEPEIRYVLWGLSLSPVLIAVSGAIRGYFQGMQDMLPTAVSQVIENVAKVALGVGLVFLMMKWELPGYISISGASIGISAGFVLAALYLLREYYRKRREFLPSEAQRPDNEKKGELLQKILWVAIPVTISSAMVSIMGFIDSTTIYQLYTSMGESQEAARTALSSVTTVQTVINVPLAISAALAFSILPAIAVAGVRGNKTELNEKVNMALQLAMKMGLPAMVGIFLLAEPILTLLYREKISAGLLQIYSVCMLFMILAQSVSSILQGLSGYYKTLLAVLLAVAFKLGGNVLLLKAGLGAAALIWSSLIYFAVIFGINYFFLKKRTELKLDFGRILWKPLLASAGMGGMVWLAYQAVTAVLRGARGNFLAIILAVTTAVPIYALLMGVLRGFTAEEILILPRGEKLLAYAKKWKWL